MWRGFGADDPEPPAQRSYFRPRISSISGVLAMTKQRLFTSGPIKDEVHEHVAHTASIHPVASGPGGSSVGHSGGTHLLTEQYLLNGGLARCPSPARSSYGDVMSFSRSASARPSIDSQTAHAIYGDPLGIHDPSEAEHGGVGGESDGRFVKRSRKIIRGFFLMLIIAFSWVTTVHLLRMSFHTERVLLSISPIAGNYNYSLIANRARNNRQAHLNDSTAHLPPNQRPALPHENILHLPATTVRPAVEASTLTNFAVNRSRNHNNEYPRSNFDAPYFVTWYCTIWNIFYLPIYLMIHTCCLSRSRSGGSESNSASVGGSAVSNNGAFGSSTSTNKNDSVKESSSNSDEGSSTSVKKAFGESVQGLMDKGFTMVQFLWRCAFFCTLCTLANYMLIFSLRILDCTVVMSLFSTTASFIYLLSWVVLHQQFVGIRIVAIIITDTGIALLVYMDGVQRRTLATVMIACGSAVVFAIYKVFMRRMIGYSTFAQMALFHSIVGLLNALFAWPMVLLLYWTGVETIIWSEIPWGYMTAAAACAFLANVVASFGAICTYEAFLTLGLFFAIPISAVIDIYINSVIFRDMKLAGILLILVGFVACLLPDNWNGYLTGIFRNRLAKWKQREELKKSLGRAQDTSTGQLSRLRTSSGRVK